MRDESAVGAHGGGRARGAKLGMLVAILGLLGPAVLVETAAQAAPTVGACSNAGTALDSLCIESSADSPTQPPYDLGISKGDRISEFKWLVSADDTGDPSFTAANVNNCLPARAATSNPSIYSAAGSGDLADCPWPSVHTSNGHSSVVSSGDQDEVDALSNLADGKYLISVTAADHKIDGVHFTVDGGLVYSVNDIVGAPFVVRMNPMPKKTATLRVHVYNDNASTNGQWDGQTETLITCADVDPDLPAPPVCGGNADPTTVLDPETDMSGFSVSIADVLDTTTTDVYNNPLCTQYVEGPDGILLDDGGAPIPLTFGAGGASGGALAGTESTCLSDHYGDIVIPNMGPNRYAVSVIPPDPRTHNGDQWVQTTTLEGGHDWDSWNIEGGSGYDTELIVGGERVTPVAHGFVKLTHSDAERATMSEADYYNAAPGFTGGTPGKGVLTGRIRIGRAYIGSGGASPLAGVNITNAKEDGAIEDGLISISCLATCGAPTDTTVWTGRASPVDGSFTVTGLQSGDYSVAFWDESQSYILAVLAYTINGDQTQPALPAVTAATRQNTGPQATRNRLQFAADPHLTLNTAVTLVGGNNGWAGSFAVSGAITVTGTGINQRWSVPVRATGQTNNPTGTATVLPQAFSGPFSDPAATDAGDILLPGWFTDLQGTVFVDSDGDGIHDPDEQGIPDFTVTVRTRGNSLQDQGAALANTDEEGSYDLSQAYPLGQFLIAEAYNPRFKSTGYSYWTDNDPEVHSVLSAQVDIAFLPVIGLSAHLDWGVQPYEGNENGGIVGTVSYDVTRNEFDPAFSGAEDYQPSVPDLPVQLWKVSKSDGINPDKTATGAIQQIGIDKTSGAACPRPDDLRGTDAVSEGQSCLPYDYYITETFARPTGCMALDVNGNKLDGEMALPDSPDVKPAADSDFWSHTDPTQPDCVEAPMSGFQIGGDGTVNGNYALTNLVNPTSIQSAPSGGDPLVSFYLDKDSPNWDPLPSDDYVVEVVSPVDTVNTATTTDHNIGGYFADPDSGSAPRRLYKFTDETAINVMTGDSYVPQGGYSPSGDAGGGDYSLDTSTIDNIRQDSNTLGAGTVAKCAGGLQTVNQDNNPDLAGAGGSPYVGTDVPVCDSKLVKVVGGRSVNPTFFVYTDVPIPSKFYGLVNDDLNVQTDRRSIMLGEVAPLSNGPVGIYDENGNWKYTAHSDVNGFYEVLLPSMDTYNCPLPAGPCPNVYRLVGNDPGTLDHRNLDYNPQFRTIATEFQAWTGVIHPVDQAPTHQGITIEGPAAQFGALSLCKVNAPDTAVAQMTPELFAIDKPYYNPATAANGGDSGGGTSQPKTYSISGIGFGDSAGTLKLGNTTVTTLTWNDRTITFRVPTAVATNPGPYQLSITNAASGLSTVNGLTFHSLASSGSSYYRIQDVYEVRSATAAGAPILVDNPGSRIYTPAHDPWDTVDNTGPAGFSGLDINNNSVSGGRAIQRAIEAAHGNNGGTAKLIVIYPNTAANYAPHNADASYFENVVIHGKVKLQGVGPGGAYTSTDIVHGSHIDGSQFWSATQVVPPGGNQQTSDGSYSDDWRTFAAGLTRAGAGPVEIPEGEGILAIAESVNQYANLSVTVGPNNNRRTYADLSVPKALAQNGVDGMVISGGDQQGNPGNINTVPGAIGDVTPGPTNPGPAQGGAIMLDQYVRDFNITNNQIQSNGGTYGTIRIGTPDLGPSAADQHNHNERLTVANNRIIANGGTNLAGALGLFYGADRYTVTGNDFCGNFSAEYGGAISHYGASAGGTISRNRIYYNQSYDEGGGIIIAGALPALGLSQGAGGVWVNGFTGTGNNRQPINVRAGVTIDSNTLVSNQSNDDGGGIRFLMAGNFPFLVQNNVIANNLSTHDGGGVALDDAPDVTLVNNTIVKNITTGTAATNAAVGNIRLAHPAGLSTGGNSSGLQATLPLGSPTYSNPKMFNNIFADNRAGWAELPTTLNYNTSAIHGIGGEGDLSPVQVWDMGVVGNPGTLSPTNTVLSTPTTLQNAVVAGGVTSSPTNVYTDIGPIGFVKPVDFVVDSLGWRVNNNVSYPVLVAQMVPVSLLADYHLSAPTGPAFNRGASSKAGTNAPATDIDNETRPALGGFDAGADEAGLVKADLAITKTDGVTSVNAGAAVQYTVVVTNNGPGAAAGTAVNDAVPAALTGVTWTCAAGAGATCATASGSGSITNRLVDLAGGASATFTVNGTLSASASGTLANTATVTAPSTVSDPNTGNNSATDTDTIIANRPTLTVLDNFNRANANNLNNGTNWSQLVLLGTASIRVNANQAFGQILAGQAVWNNPTGGFGARQGAAFTFANAPLNGTALMLKGSGGSASVPANYIRVRYDSGAVIVDATTNAGLTFTGATSFAAAFASGDTLTAVANSDGSVDVWRTTAANVTTYLGQATTGVAGTGRIGMQLPVNARIDNFAGGTLP